MTDRTDHENEPHADDLRQAIDRGHTGDKVAAEDPSAAPLGTDDEAAGQPPEQSQVRRALERERRDVHPPAEKGGPRTWITMLVIGLVLLTLLIVLANWAG